MESQLSSIISNIYDEASDSLFVYKLFNNPSLLESLINIGTSEIFTTLEPFCNDELQVCIFELNCFYFKLKFFKCYLIIGWVTKLK